MPHDPVEIVRQHIEAFQRDDVDAARSFLDADVIVDTTRVRGSVGGVWHGHEGLIREVQRFMGAFQDYAFELERMSYLGGGTVAVVMTERGHGKGSGILVERTSAALYSVIDGKIVRITGFPSEEEALKAVGASN